MGKDGTGGFGTGKDDYSCPSVRKGKHERSLLRRSTIDQDDDREWEQFNREMDARESNPMTREEFDELIGDIAEVNSSYGTMNADICTVSNFLALLKRRAYKRKGWSNG